MKRCITWFLAPLLIGVAAGLALSLRSSHACSPQRVFWVVEKADPQPDDALADAALWPRGGQLGPRWLTLQEGQAWLRIEY